MPLGVPKIPKQKYDNEEPSWTEVFHLLYEQRILFLAKPLDDDLANDIMSLMIYLCIDDRFRDQFLFINCSGGAVISGIGVYDTMQYVQSEIYTIGVGKAFSIGSIVLAGGHPGKRLAFRNTRVMLHQPSSVYPEEDLPAGVIRADWDVSRIRTQMVGIYLERTHQTIELDVWRDLERDTYMSAEGAVEYGIIDYIYTDGKVVPPWLRDWRYVTVMPPRRPNDDYSSDDD